MSLWEQITNVYPELTDKDFMRDGIIELRNDGDGMDYISRWDYSNPIPAGFKLGK